MNKRLNKRKLGIFTLIILLIVFGMIIFLSNNEDNSGLIKIGAILPLSGEYSVLGDEIKNGMELAKNELSKDWDVEFIYEDDESFSSRAVVNAAHKLVDIDNVDVVLTSTVEESMPSSSIFNDKKVPLIVVWDSNRYIKEGGDYLFSTGFSTEKAGEEMAVYAYETLNLRNVAVISHIDPWAEIISESFQEKFEFLGGTIKFHDTFDITEGDYRTGLLRIKSLNVDGIYFPLLAPTSVNFLKQVYEMGLNVSLLTGDALFQDVIDEAGIAAENVYYTNIYIEDTKVLEKKYKEFYQKEPIDIRIVSFGYEGVMTIMDAASLSLDIRDGLVSVIGESRSYDRVERIYIVENGKPRLVG